MIYFDNAATTKMYEECLGQMRELGIENFYNPSAVYSSAASAADCVAESRAAIAKTLGCNANELIFTASGSESDNMALFSSLKRKKGKIIVGACEHAAIYYSALELRNKGFDVIFAPCDCFGAVILDDNFISALDEDVVLVSVMHVCNETGAINDIARISALVHERCPNAVVHSDGVQAFGKLYVDVKELGVDLYSVSGHKIHAPKGIGALYAASNVHLKPFIFGGGQEYGVRSATENVAAIAAFAYAATRSADGLEKKSEKTAELKVAFIDDVNRLLSDVSINTEVDASAPHIVSLAVRGLRGETIVRCMEEEGFLIGTGSACSSNKRTRRVAEALGLPENCAEGMIRVSFDEENTLAQVGECAEALARVCRRLEIYKRK